MESPLRANWIGVPMPIRRYLEEHASFEPEASFNDFYKHKAEQCDRLAAVATDPHERAKYQDEAALWRDIAKDIARQDRDEGGPP